MIGRMSSKGKCAMIAWALHGFLSWSEAIESRVYECKVGDWNHIYLVLKDGRILDCAADQFSKRYPKVYLGPGLPIHKNGRRFKLQTTL